MGIHNTQVETQLLSKGWNITCFINWKNWLEIPTLEAETAISNVDIVISQTLEDKAGKWYK